MELVSRNDMGHDKAIPRGCGQHARGDGYNHRGKYGEYPAELGFYLFLQFILHLSNIYNRYNLRYKAESDFSGVNRAVAVFTIM